MRTETETKRVAAQSFAKRPTGVKPAVARPTVAPLYPGVKTLDDWHAWMSARGRFQWDSEE